MSELITWQELPTYVPGRIMAKSDALGWKGVAHPDLRLSGPGCGDSTGPRLPSGLLQDRGDPDAAAVRRPLVARNMRAGRRLAPDPVAAVALALDRERLREPHLSFPRTGVGCGRRDVRPPGAGGRAGRRAARRRHGHHERDAAHRAGGAGARAWAESSTPISSRASCRFTCCATTPTFGCAPRSAPGR